MSARKLCLLFCLLISRITVSAQTIRGEVLDMDDKHTLQGVSIENIYTMLDISSGDQGAFIIAASGGQLLEFKKPGYKTTRVRIPKGYIPSYFRIIMQKGITDIKEVDIAANNRYNYRNDSIRMHELYKHELDFPKMSTIDMISHPFTALSSRNQEVWHFQDDFQDAEREKYVDRSFNEALITRITGLKGDSLRSYMRRFRPSYEQVRSMNDYAFYNYIKNTVRTYRSHDTPRGAQ
jgi:hypothetical protein